MARYYNPKHSVFLSVDPELSDDETVEMNNAYSYSANNPVMKFDINGRAPWLIPVAYGVHKVYKTGKKIYRNLKRKGYSFYGPQKYSNGEYRLIGYRHKSWEKGVVTRIDYGKVKFPAKSTTRRPKFKYHSNHSVLHYHTKRNNQRHRFFYPFRATAHKKYKGKYRTFRTWRWRGF